MRFSNIRNFIKKVCGQHTQAYLKTVGICPICEQSTTFQSNEEWLRDHYLCLNCGSIPRERALMRVLKDFFPNWKELVIHETSPANRGVSPTLQQHTLGYIGSQYYPGIPSGEMHNGYRSEDLEALSFEDNSIDLHISQDVLEHLFSPEKAFAEIARTLKPGGAHIFTVPIVNQHTPTSCRAQRNSAHEIVHFEAPQYHGNPISSEGSLVTFDWGYDIVKIIWQASSLTTWIIQIDDVSQGIRAKYIDVFVSKKHN